MRKIGVSLIILIFLTGTMHLNNVMAAADIINPTLESIQVDKTEATVGDTVKISVKATDDVGVNQVYVYYTTPITGKQLYVSMSYNSSTKMFEGSISIENNSESGLYKISYVSIYDTSDNGTTVFSSTDRDNKLVGAQFNVTGTTAADIKNPTLESIQVDKTEPTVGDTVKVSVKATDDVEVSQVYVYYTTPITGKQLYVSMSYNSSTKMFEGSIPIENNSESGLYKISYVSIYDTSDNGTTVFPSTDRDNKLVGAQFNVTGTTASDIKNPTLESMQVDKTEATVGDTVKVSVKATDDVGVNQVYVYYTTPITGKQLYVSMSYNSLTKMFEGSIPVENNSESGLYKISYVSIYDTSDNGTTVFSSTDRDNKLVGAQFTVYTESNPPIYKSLSIDKNVVESGDQVNISVDASDDTNLKEATIHYISPVTKTNISVPLTYNDTHFTGQMPIDQTTEVGNWVVGSIEIKDTNENLTTVKAEDNDLSAGNFSVIKSVDPLNNDIVTSNESWSNKIVNSDVYIVPGAILTIDSNVTINGNVYVLGGLRSYGGLQVNGILKANSIYFGYYYPSDGQAIFTGSNNITSMIATNQILTSVPFNLYNTPLISNNGKVNLSGATLPFVNLKINGQSIALKSNGTFRYNDFDMGDKEQLDVEITDINGKKYTYTYKVSEIFIDDFTKDSQTITGTTHANSLVKILQDGELIGSGTSNEDGKYEISVKNLIENRTLTFMLPCQSERPSLGRNI